MRKSKVKGQRSMSAKIVSYGFPLTTVIVIIVMHVIIVIIVTNKYIHQQVKEWRYLLAQN